MPDPLSHGIRKQSQRADHKCQQRWEYIAASDERGFAVPNLLCGHVVPGEIAVVTPGPLFNERLEGIPHDTDGNEQYLHRPLNTHRFLLYFGLAYGLAYGLFGPNLRAA